MSLFGSLQTASNTLQAMQIGLQVVSNNIANANTEGFIREQANYTPAPVQKIGNLTIGLGVRVESITQKVDEFLGNQLRGASGERASADLQNEAYKDLESLLNELGGSDLSTALTGFFGSIEDTLNDTGDTLSVRNLAVLEGKQLASEINRIEGRAKEIRDRYDAQITQSVGQVNQLAEEIVDLNIRITQIEGGSAAKSDAGALRAARNQAVNELTELVDATVTEQPSGGLAVTVGGEFLVFEGQLREISVDNGDSSADSEEDASSRLIFSDTGKELELDAGRVHGLTVARDEIVDGFREDLDRFASNLIHEFNKVHSQGQGLDGFESITSQVGVFDPTAALNEAGLPFAVENGSFSIAVIDGTDGGEQSSTHEIQINTLDNGEPNTTLASIAEQIDAIDGLDASVGSDGRLTIETTDTSATFVFSNDDSGFLASVGLNTFFTGSGAADIGINSELDGIQNAGKLALSRPPREGEDGSIPSGKTGNAVRLAALIDQPLDALDGASLIEQYDQLVNELAQNSTVAGSVAEGLGVFEATLANEFQSVSGVNIDEEAIDMISLQRIYQATARVISTIQEMLDVLVRL